MKITLKEILYKIFKNNSLEEKVEFIDLNRLSKDNYHTKIELFYKSYENKGDEGSVLIAQIAKILAGDYRENNKRIWRWEDRINKVKELYDAKKILHRKKEVQKLINILEDNKYLKRKYSDKFQNLHNILLSYKNLNITKNRRKIIFRRVLGYTFSLFLATYLFLSPKIHKINSSTINNKNITYSVKNKDTLWDITENYLRTRNFSDMNNKLIYDYCNKIAGFNGKGKQADYKIGLIDEKSPHYLKPNQILILPYINN